MRSHRTGLRGLFVLCAAILTLVTAVSLLVLFGTATVFQRSMETVSRDTRSAAIAHELEVAALLYQRLANLYRVSADEQLVAEKAEVAGRLVELSEQARLYVGPGQEAALLDRVSRDLDEYRQVRDRLDASVDDIEDVIRRTSPVLTGALDGLEALRELNREQVDSAHRDARRAQRLSGVFGGVAALLLITGLAGLTLLIRRLLFVPLVDLFDAMAAFRAGDLGVRGRIEGARELAELTGMFNEMADSVARQRQAQLAFLAGVAHDLKNPLTTLRNGVYLMALDGSAEGRQRRRATLNHEIDQLARMVDDVMDAARIEAGALELRCRAFDLRQLVRSLIQSYGAVTPGHELVGQLPAHPLTLQADPLRVEQVLRNLIGNAIKYSSGGRIVVRAEARGETIRLSVRDHGVGIAPEEIADLFLPFRRRRLDVAPGVGLGLSVVKRIVEAHGGSVEVDSEVGVGSTFTVCLPSGGPPAPESSHAGRRALPVD